MNKLKPILYYSNLCQHSRELLQFISKTGFSHTLHFICIDNRYIDKENKIQLVLENTKTIPLPDVITQVPSLLIIHKNNMVVTGNQIRSYLESENRQKPTEQIVEPESFDFGNGGMQIIQSDIYSFLDQTVEELSAKGNGGLRQIYNYFTVDQMDDIVTPPEDYTPNKISKDTSLEKLVQDRNSDISMKR